MKRCSVLLVCFATACILLVGFVHAGAAGTETQKGKVIAIDPGGKAIVISVGMGEKALTVGAVIKEDTKLMVKGKMVPLSDLEKAVKVGDTVTLKYVRTDDLYATEIVKK